MLRVYLPRCALRYYGDELRHMPALRDSGVTAIMMVIFSRYYDIAAERRRYFLRVKQHATPYAMMRAALFTLHAMITLPLCHTICYSYFVATRYYIR